MRWPPQSALLMLMSGPVSAQDVSLLYSDSDLQQIGNRYTPNLRGMWDEDFLSRLTIAERLRGGAFLYFFPWLVRTATRWTSTRTPPGARSSCRSRP